MTSYESRTTAGHGLFAWLDPLRLAAISAALLLVTGCATPVYTVDDGSPVDEQLLSEIRLFGKGHEALRPSIVKTALLADKDCDTQWELPFAVASSYDLPKEKKIAWVRGLAVDERLSVIAATNSCGLAVGDKIEELNGYKRENTEKMHEELTDLRDSGDPFDVKLAGGRTVRISPVKVCRGHVEITPPESDVGQEYHWLKSMHPLSVFTQTLTPDEALWVVLWTQGLSEEAGARMKLYHYGLKFTKAAIKVASVASSVGALASAANTVAASTATAAGNVAAQAAAQAAAKALAQQVADSMRRKMIESAQTLLKQQAQEVAIDSIKASAIFKNSLSGISWVAGTGFYMADQWAFDRMAALGADPVAAFTLHYKLASNAFAQNAFVFDEERLQLIGEIAQKKEMGDKMALALSGEDPNAPAASRPVAENSQLEMRSLEDASAAPTTTSDEGGRMPIMARQEAAAPAGEAIAPTQD
ncbi:MAG: hypothetical protein WAZ34_17315 [Rhodocyclaceae bacterium]